MNAQTIPSEAGHWYSRTGAPAYETIGKNGKTRPTTLRDARAYSLVPSVTTIMQVVAKPGLEKWKAQQVLLSALTLPRNPGESLDDYAERVMEDSKEQAKKAMDRGTELHADLERHYKSEWTRPENRDFVLAAAAAIAKEFGRQDWVAEKSFCSLRGFGGKCDLHSDEWVVDFKTKAFTADNLPKTYDEHAMQLAAYRKGLGKELASCAIVFVSTESPLCHIVILTEEEIKRGWQMFEAALDLWVAMKKYDPAAQRAA